MVEDMYIVISMIIVRISEKESGTVAHLKNEVRVLEGWVKRPN